MTNLWKKPWVKPVLIGLFISFMLVFSFAAIAGHLLIRATRGTVTTTEPITRTTGLVLPKNTRVLGGTWIWTPMKVELYAKVSMPSADALQFFKQPVFEPLAPGDDVLPEYALDEMKKRGWSWGTQQNTFSCKKMSPSEGDELGATYCLLDQTDPQTTTVYLFRNW